jgi:hypothetical protein
MTVKYKIAFQIDAETLFAIMSKFLPLENLSVEEVIERPVTAHAPRITHAAKVAKIGPKKGRRTSNLNEGVNSIIISELGKGLRSYAALKQAINASGVYSSSGIGSRLQRLVEIGAIVKASPGVYALPERQKESA